MLEKVFEGLMPKSSTTSVLFMEKRATKPSRSNTTRKPCEVDPKYVNAYVNLASTMLNGEQRINEEIDKLPLSLNAEQKKQYDELVGSEKGAVQGSGRSAGRCTQGIAR